MQRSSQYHITCEFDYNGTRYIAYLGPYFELSELELQAYNIQEFNYVVHLFSMEGFKTFEMSPDNRAGWKSNAQPGLLEPGISEIMSYILVNALR